MMCRFSICLRGGLAAVVLAAQPIRAAENSLPAVAPRLAAGDPIIQQEQKQQQLKTTTKRVGDQLETIIAEFDRNGIAGEDVVVLRAIRSVLDHLSEKDMGKVIEFLKQARSATEPAASNRTATEAFAAQKSIIVQLQQLVLEYQRQQALYEISLRLKELAGRQTANMWLGVALAKSTEGRSSFVSYDENQKISLRYQQSEQNPLKDEVAAILKRLERVAEEITDGSAAERPKAALEQGRKGGLMPALESAVGELKEDNLKLLSAIGNEKKARDQLREMARLLILSQDATDALKQAILELDRAIDTQKKVKSETAVLKRRDEADKRTTDQAALVDETDLIRKDIDSIAPVASEYLRAATDRMQEARSALGANDEVKTRVEQSVPKQDDALLQMALARHALEEQLARAEQMQTQPENALAAIRQLQEEVRELIRKEEELKSEAGETPQKDLAGKAPRQGEFKDSAQRLQTRAAAPSPEAARSIGDAAAEMQKAQNSFAQQQNNPSAQQAAIDALQRADQQLGQDIEKLEQAEKDLALLEEILKRLIAVIEAEQKLESATTVHAVNPVPDPDQVRTLSPIQAALALETDQLARDASMPAPRAGQYLASAKARMDEGKAALDKADPKDARQRESDALEDLYLAKRELEKKIDELRDQLGMPPSQSMDALAAAQERIQKAQQEVNKALSELQQAPPGMMEALQKQQQEIAEALRERRQDAPDSKDLLGAEQAAAEAAQQMARSNLPQAVNSMKAAENAMQQAGQAGAKDPAGLQKLGSQQAEVRKAAESLAEAQRAASNASMQSAAEALQNAANTLSPLTSGALGPMPAGAQSALQSARGATSQGSAQASAGQNTPAQMSATEAANALAQAQAALALAQAGLGSQMASAGQGQTPGQGQSQGQGQGQSPGQGKGKTPGKGNPSPQGTGEGGNWQGSGGADGSRNGVAGAGTFTRLPDRDRAAIRQSQSEKYPQEFGPLVEQYLKNLSDQAGEK